jgi:SAM-dependent methyltransferase
MAGGRRGWPPFRVNLVMPPSRPGLRTGRKRWGRMSGMGAIEPARRASRDAAYFDQWYADMQAAPDRDAIVTRTLGLPPELQSSSLLTWAGIAEVTEALRLPPGGLLVDAACGRGGYGIEVARRSGARLLGVDFSAVALRQARLAGARRLPPGRSQFQAGTLTATGLAAGTADGLMCVDAVQFAEPPLAALAEFRRVLAPGGRLAVSCWEAAGDGAELASPRIQAVHLDRDLRAAGFADVQVREMPQWREAERRMWQEVMAAPAGADAGMRSLQAEGRRSLETFGSVRRVFGTAAAP